MAEVPSVEILQKALRLYKDELGRPREYDLGQKGDSRAILRSYIRRAVILNSQAQDVGDDVSVKSDDIQEHSTDTEMEPKTAVQRLKESIKERLVISRLGLVKRLVRLDDRIDKLRIEAQAEKEEELSKLMTHRLHLLSMSHKKRTLAMENGLMSELRDLHAKFRQERENLDRKHVTEFMNVIDVATKRATGETKQCSCMEPYLCKHNKFTTSSMRKPTKQVLKYRMNSTKLKASGRVGDADQWDTLARKIDAKEQEKWRQHVATRIIQSPWGATEAKVDTLTETHKKELAANLASQRTRMDMIQRRHSDRRKNFQNLLSAEVRRLKHKYKKEAINFLKNGMERKSSESKVASTRRSPEGHGNGSDHEDDNSKMGSDNASDTMLGKRVMFNTNDDDNPPYRVDTPEGLREGTKSALSTPGTMFNNQFAGNTPIVAAVQNTPSTNVDAGMPNMLGISLENKTPIDWADTEANTLIEGKTSFPALGAFTGGFSGDVTSPTATQERENIKGEEGGRDDQEEVKNVIADSSNHKSTDMGLGGFSLLSSSIIGVDSAVETKQVNDMHLSNGLRSDINYPLFSPESNTCVNDDKPNNMPISDSTYASPSSLGVSMGSLGASPETKKEVSLDLMQNHDEDVLYCMPCDDTSTQKAVPPMESVPNNRSYRSQKNTVNEGSLLDFTHYNPLPSFPSSTPISSVVYQEKNKIPGVQEEKQGGSQQKLNAQYINNTFDDIMAMYDKKMANY